MCTGVRQRAWQTWRRWLIGVVLISSCLCIFYWTRDKPAQVTIPPINYAPDSVTSRPFFAVSVDGKKGFINRSGTMVIEPAFEGAYSSSEGLAAVKLANRWGFIDGKGELVIAPRFATAGSFHDGLSKVRIEFDSKVGFIDKTGKMAIEPEFDCAGDFRYGVARVGYATLLGRLKSSVADVNIECDYFYIDKGGQRVDVHGRNIGTSSSARGSTTVRKPFWKDGKMGFVDSGGNVVIKPRFQHVVLPFRDGLALFSTEDGTGYIDENGTIIWGPSK